MEGFLGCNGMLKDYLSILGEIRSFEVGQSSSTFFDEFTFKQIVQMIVKWFSLFILYPLLGVSCCCIRRGIRFHILKHTSTTRPDGLLTSRIITTIARTGRSNIPTTRDSVSSRFRTARRELIKRREDECFYKIRSIWKCNETLC